MKTGQVKKLKVSVCHFIIQTSINFRDNEKTLKIFKQVSDNQPEEVLIVRGWQKDFKTGPG